MKATSRKAISKILSASVCGDRLKVVFAPVTEACWLRKNVHGKDGICDAEGSGIYSATMARIVDGNPCTMRVTGGTSLIVTLMDESGEEPICISAMHIAAIESLPSPVNVQVDGLSYELALDPSTGECKVGCQTLTRLGCEQAFRALGAHLGYKITG